MRDQATQAPFALPAKPVFNDPKTAVLAGLLRERCGAVPGRMLVVGCGSGVEAAVLAQHLNTSVLGLDILPDFDAAAAACVELRQGDATCMEFPEASFDFVYSFHALEHIPQYRTALREIRRVLKPGGGYLVGTPNRRRLIGYLGAKDTSLRDKIRWNMADWKAMLRGRFRNELGAHAGYTSDELRTELEAVFHCAHDITPDYYLRLYARRRALVETLFNSGAWRWLVPAVYFYGTR